MARPGDVRRPNSCSGAPGKIVERIRQRATDLLRIIRCQDLLAPAPEHCRRRPAALGCDLKRPNKMLTRVTQADAQPVMPTNPVVEVVNMFELLGERRSRFDDASFEAASDLPRQPWLALRTATDHHRIRPRHFECADGLLERRDVAINDKRNTYRFPDLTHRSPIRPAVVELAAGATMHGNQLNAGFFRAAPQFRRVQ